MLDQTIVNEFSGRKILHADDSPTARKQVSDTLSQLGIEIVPASNGLEALNMLKGWADEGRDVEKRITYGDYRCRNALNGWLSLNL